MATRSVNKVILVGNLTRDPELRYTPQGTAVCDFGLATNRDWTTSDGERQEAAEFHNLVAWRKLAELCDQLLKKGSKVYIEGRLQTRDWTNDQGERRYKTEIVVREMILLRGGKPFDSEDDGDIPAESPGANKGSVEADIDTEEVDLDEILADTDFDLEDEEE